MVTEKELIQLKYDKAQMQFAIDGTIIINQKVIDEKTPITALINESHYWICPFCLETSNKFTIENHGLVKCPNCIVQMKVKTLLFVKDCSNQDFAKWVFEYRLSGFFKKINFEKWNKKLHSLGMSYEFWDEYKKLKGENEESEKEENIDYDVQEKFINILIKKIDYGFTKEEILKELQDVDVTLNFIDYCYNEAQLRIKRR